jgi:hypothetical protein
MATTTSSKLPVLYATPVPDEKTDLEGHLRESLRRVRRSFQGGVNARSYRFIGVAGEWRVQPEDHFTTNKPGRGGPWIVKESGPQYEVLDTRTFDHEASAWAWVTTEHAQRVDARMDELALRNVIGCDEKLAKLATEAEAVRRVRGAWNTILTKAKVPS